jgi:hypothetical protein
VSVSEPWGTPQRLSASRSDSYTNILHKGRRPEVCQPRVSDSEPWVFKKNEKKLNHPKTKKYIFADSTIILMQLGEL